MTHVAAQARVPKKGLLVFLGVAGVLLLLGTFSVLRGVVADSGRVDVVNVVDGNTVVVNAGGKEKTVVLAGVAAAPRNPQGVNVGPEFCLGEEAYVWLRDRLPQGAVASIKTSRDGAPEGMESAVVTLGGKTVNADMAAAGMAVPTGVGVSGGTKADIAQGNREAIGREVGLYDVERKCTLNHRLYEATYALQQIPKDAEPTVEAIDQRAVEYADALDQVRLVQEDLRRLDPSQHDFTNLAYGPAKDQLLAKADKTVEDGLKVLQDLNTRRNQIASHG